MFFLDVNDVNELKLGSCTEIMTNAASDRMYEERASFDSYDTMHDMLEPIKTEYVTNSSLLDTTTSNCCSICGQSASDEQQLVEHMQFHATEMLQCESCNESFSHLNLLRSHMLQQHGIEHKTYECSECSANFMHISLLQRHAETHKDAGNHMCDKCGTIFMTENKLLNHVQQKHSKDRQFVCSECGKAFARSADFRRHMSRHSGDKPHVCTHCSARFAVFTDLTRHLMVHTTDRPFACDVCSRTFTRSERFKRHKCRP